MSLEAGEEFTAEIANITNNGKAIVKHGDSLINIGPVNCEQGRQVRLKYLGEKEEYGNDVGYAICLNDEILGSDYREYISNMVDLLVVDEPPEPGEITYARIKDIGDRNLGSVIIGDQRFHIGPVQEDIGQLVRLKVVDDSYAKVQTSRSRGKNYETRFKILSEQIDDLPVDTGQEVTTVISDSFEDQAVGKVGKVSIYFPDHDAKIGQKVDAQVTEVDMDRFVGEVINTYDEPGRSEHASHWARMQWLRDAGFAEDPLREFARDFIAGSPVSLPETTDRLRDALVAEAIRLALADKIEDSDDGYPRVHISGLQHWVSHKLAAVLGNPHDEDTDNWFINILKERSGPTMTFLGDVLELSGGYYAPAPTHAVMTSTSDAVLVSGDPTIAILDEDLKLEIRGVTRIITDTSEEELRQRNIPVQSLSEYVGLDGQLLRTEDDLIQFIDHEQDEEWAPEQNWMPYTGQWGFQQDEEPLTVELSDGSVVSFWHQPVEYGRDRYRLKVHGSSDEPAVMMTVPSQYRRHMSLLMDYLSGESRRLELKQTSDGVLLNCDFVPPRPQIRWLHAIGANWIETSVDRLQWVIRRSDVESVTQVFDPLPISIDNSVPE